MMKFLILTLVTLSVGFSECYGFDFKNPPKIGKYTIVEALAAFFNIQKKELDVKCKQLDDRIRLYNVYQNFQDVKNKKPPQQPGYEYTYQRNVVASAMPCATADEWNNHLDYYKSLPASAHPGY